MLEYCQPTQNEAVLLCGLDIGNSQQPTMWGGGRAQQWAELDGHIGFERLG